MPEPLTSYIVDLHYKYIKLEVDLHNMSNYFVGLSSALKAEGNPSSGIAVDNIVVHLLKVKDDFTDGTETIRYCLIRCLQWMDSNWGGGAAFDMDTLLNEMLSASFPQLQKFVGLVDAYRLAIWNAPFNAEWYASLARGFQKWP